MWLFFCAVLTLLWACGMDSDYKQVDFTKIAPNSGTGKHEIDRKFLRIAIAAIVSPKETMIYYRELIDYLGAKSNHEIVLIQRKTYGEVNDLLTKGQIDLAFICTGPFVAVNQKYGFEAVATPIVRGTPFYQSYLIVHKDSSLNSFADLKGKKFAFTDPDSNSGSLVPRHWLKQLDTLPEAFFESFTYTYSHDNSILAVAKKLVDGAAVDGHIWEYYQQRNDFYSGKTRVIKKSEPFGSPPLVISKQLDPRIKSVLVDIIMNMHQDPQGREILSELMIERFTAPKAEWYESVKKMYKEARKEPVES